MPSVCPGSCVSQRSPSWRVCRGPALAQTAPRSSRDGPGGQGLCCVPPAHLTAGLHPGCPPLPPHSPHLPWVSPCPHLTAPLWPVVLLSGPNAQGSCSLAPYWSAAPLLCQWADPSLSKLLLGPFPATFSDAAPESLPSVCIRTRPRRGIASPVAIRRGIPLQGRQGSRGCIPGSPGESGLVLRGKKGLRSPVESRRVHF